MHLFGEIDQDEMQLNDLGKIANQCWLAIPEHFPNAVLHEYVIMPNHVHGIVELKNGGPELTVGGVPTVGVENIQPLPPPTAQSSKPSRRNEYQKMIPRSIGSIVKGFKIGVTNWCRINTDIENMWQRNYYEHIIRDEISYHRISGYIRNNPKNWNNDKFNRSSKY